MELICTDGTKSAAKEICEKLLNNEKFNNCLAVRRFTIFPKIIRTLFSFIHKIPIKSLSSIELEKRSNFRGLYFGLLLL